MATTTGTFYGKSKNKKKTELEIVTTWQNPRAFGMPSFAFI